MAKKYEQLSKAQLVEELRRRDAEALGPGGLGQVVHDLRVQQEEIRVQNEQLMEVQKSLEESRDRYADLYDFAPVAYVTLDRDGLIVEINLTGTALLGVERARLIGSPLLVYVVERDRGQFLDHMAACRRGGGDVRTDLSLRRRGGHDGPASVPVTLASNAPPGVAQPMFRTAIIDLTAQRQAERERQDLLSREQAAKAASEAKDRFLAILSHELRTPLTPVLAAVSALDSRHVPKGLAPTLRMIRRNVQLEANLIDDLLDITRINRNKLKLEFAEVDAHAAIREVLEMCREELDERRMRVELRLDAADATVRADPVRLRQVIWNVVRNAIKFSTARGLITLATDNPTPGDFRLRVSDTGVGIEADMLERIFSPFEQAETNGDRARGLGLGLAICRALMEAHGGAISASSDGIGKGASFVVTFPAVPTKGAAAAAHPPGAAAPAAAAASRRALSILLVEDHLDTAHIMGKLLRAKGHRVRAAPTLRQALEAAAEPFDLLISDIGLPDGSGLQLMCEIRRRHSPDVPGIALSGFGSEDDVRKSKAAGFEHHLVKPIDFDRLIKVIASISERKST